MKGSRTFITGIIAIITGCVIFSGAVSCVKTDYRLGYNVIPEEDKFITRTVVIPLDSVHMDFLDSITGYTTQRMTVGSIRSPHFGLSRRNCAIALVPITDTVNWGTNVRIRGFHLSSLYDTISVSREQDINTIQGLHVYALKQPLKSSELRYTDDPLLSKDYYAAEEEITLGTPTVNGSDSLSIDFKTSFARSYIPEEAFEKGSENVKEYIDTISNYTDNHYGIFLCCDDPVGEGGRFNFFQVNMTYDDSYYITTAYAELKFTADYYNNGELRENVDTSIIFCFGPTSFDTSCSYYALNSCEHETRQNKGEKLIQGTAAIEGGTGWKPKLKASYLRRCIKNAIKDTLAKYGIEDMEKAMIKKEAIVNKACVILPYVYDSANPWDMNKYPIMLSPTVKVSKKDTVTYGGLTDASISDENQGDIDRSTLCYRPDMAFHVQEIMGITSEDTLKKYDVWFMILAAEVLVQAETSSSTLSDYYQQLAYMNYYNSMMSGGYSGYDSYSNYYSYYMMQALYSSSSSDTATETYVLDKDRYYDAILQQGAYMRLTYSFRRPQEE